MACLEWRTVPSHLSSVSPDGVQCRHVCARDEISRTHVHKMKRNVSRDGGLWVAVHFPSRFGVCWSRMACVLPWEVPCSAVVTILVQQLLTLELVHASTAATPCVRACRIWIGNRYGSSQMTDYPL